MGVFTIISITTTHSVLQHVPVGCTELTRRRSARTAATQGAARSPKALAEHFPLFPLPILIHTGTSWLLSVWGDCSEFLWDVVRRATGSLPSLPAARVRNPPMLAIVSAPTCLKFLWDTDISQQGFNNSLIIAPDNNLHCIECLPVGGWVEGLPW